MTAENDPEISKAERESLEMLLDFKESMQNLGPYRTHLAVSQKFVEISDHFRGLGMSMEADVFAQVAKEWEESAAEYKPYVEIPPRSKSPN